MTAPRQRLARLGTVLFPLGLYALVSVLFIGRGVVSAPESTAVGDRGPDKSIVMWSLAWWPHALGERIDPLVSHAVWQPHGIDLSWVTAVPGPSLVAYPLTWAVGPIVTYNVLALAAPALAGWTAFLLAREVARAYWPSVLAGYYFGFSAYLVGQSSGHLNLALVFLVPLCGLLVVLRLRRRLSQPLFVGLLGVSLAFQFLTSTEVFATLLIVGTLVGMLALWRLPGQRPRLRATAREALVAVPVAGVLVSPYLVHAFILTGPSYAPVRSPFRQSADLLNFVFPSHFTWLRPPGSASIASQLTSNPVESGAYLGAPLVVILVLAAVSRRRSRIQSVLLLAIVLVAACAVGSHVRLAGHTVTLGPWEVPAKLPVTKAILPVRLSMYAALFGALVCALWLAEPSRLRPARWALALVAVIALLPTPSRSFWTADVPNPAFFESGRATAVLSPSDTALVLPFGKAGWSMLWQAENDMGYRMIGGYLGNRPPAERRWNALYTALITGRPPAGGRPVFLHFLREHHATAVVVAPRTSRALRRLVRSLPAQERRFGNVSVYRLSRTGR